MSSSYRDVIAATSSADMISTAAGRRFERLVRSATTHPAAVHGAVRGAGHCGGGAEELVAEAVGCADPEDVEVTEIVDVLEVFEVVAVTEIVEVVDAVVVRLRLVQIEDCLGRGQGGSAGT